MVRGKALSKDMRNSIVAAHKEGVSGHIIAKKLSIPQGTVRNIISQFKQNGNIQTKVKTGRRSKITKRDVRVLRAIIKQDHQAASKQIAAKWSHAIGKSVSKDTCLRTMKKMGYGFDKVKEKSLLSFKEKQDQYFEQRSIKTIHNFGENLNMSHLPLKCVLMIHEVELSTSQGKNITQMDTKKS